MVAARVSSLPRSGREGDHEVVEGPVAASDRWVVEGPVAASDRWGVEGPAAPGAPLASQDCEDRIACDPVNAGAAERLSPARF